jgi:hypothetical protein
MSNIKFKLGKKAVKTDPRTFKFKSYFKHALPPIPSSIDWSGKVSEWGMMANDSVGDCTCAGAGHLEMTWSSQANTETIPTDEQILSAYSSITGYNPTDPNTDNGADLLSVLKYWRNSGIANHNITAFAKLADRNIYELRAAIALFGGAYIGVQLPASAQDDFSAGKPWANTNDTDIEGGHCIVLVGYTPQYFTAITWGAKQLLTPGWFARYVDEAYAVLSPQWFDAHGSAPCGFSTDQLTEDLKSI